MSYADTRYRSTDPETSQEAAKNAVGMKAALERIKIVSAVCHGPKTAREISEFTGIDYIEVQRRVAECGGIRKTDEVRGGCRVWSKA